MLNDLASFTAHFDLGREDRHAGGEPWMHRDLRADHGDDPARRHAASSSRPRSSTRSSSTAGTSPSRPATRSTSSTPPATTSTASSPPSPTRRSRGRSDRLPLADLPRAVGPQPHPLQADRPPVGVGDEADVGVAPRLAAQRDGVRRPAGRAVGPGVAGRAVLAVDGVRPVLDVRVAADARGRRSRGRAPRGRGWRRGPAWCSPARRPRRRRRRRRPAGRRPR